MSLRPVMLLLVAISAFWLTVVAPVQAAAETFLVVINASNRISGSDAELREVVRQLYLKEESRWPDDLPSLPIARPAKNPATSAFTEAVLGVSPEDLETHWAEAGAKPPGAIGPVRDLLRQISRNKGAFSVVASAEAEKLPAKVRVLFEFTTTAPDEKERLWSREDVLAYVKANKTNINNKLAYYTQLHKVIPKQWAWKNNAEILKFEIVEIRGDFVLAEITYRYGDISQSGSRVAERTFPFHLQWIDENLQFVSHGDAAVAALSPPTESGPSQTGSFDGTWVLEVRESDQPLSAAERQIVQIVDNKLKAEVSPGTWSGTIDGEIDIAGQLVGYALLSQLKSSGGKDNVFKISATFTNGAFETTAIGIGTSTYFYSIEIKLTPQQLITAVPPPGGTATKEPETAALSPSTEPAPSQAAAPEDIEPILSREDVLAYVKANKKLIQSRLAYYTTEHRLLKRQKTSSPDEAEIRQFQIVYISGDSVLAEITYKFGDVNRGSRVVEGTFPFHLQWMDENLQFVGHGEAALAALPPSTDPTPGRPGSFDGQGELVFQQIEGATGGTGSEGIVVETSVVNDRFSVRFTSSSWQGQVSGNIDESGTLVGNGWAVSRKRVTPQKFDFEAGYSAGAFQADIEFVPTWGVRVICRATLTRAS